MSPVEREKFDHPVFKPDMLVEIISNPNHVNNDWYKRHGFIGTLLRVVKAYYLSEGGTELIHTVILKPADGQTKRLVIGERINISPLVLKVHAPTNLSSLHLLKELK